MTRQQRQVRKALLDEIHHPRPVPAVWTLVFSWPAFDGVEFRPGHAFGGRLCSGPGGVGLGEDLALDGAES